MKFLKTIRFDPSDMHVFEHAAEQDEWAISGGFIFAGATENQLLGKKKQAFSNGFVSAMSFGFSTLVSVTEILPEQLSIVKQSITNFALETMGANTPEQAMHFAEGEVSFVSEMCSEVPINSIFALNRYFDEAGEIREEFRILKAPHEALHARVWDVVEE